MTLLDFIFRRNHNQEVSERHVVANNNEANKPYCNNYIKTSKYNLLTFLPINLFEQFQKSANLYFLIQIIIMSIPKITALAPSSTAIPLTLVLLATMVKDGYDDYGRHTSDSTINSKDTQVLKDNEWKKTKWRDVQAGDIVRVDDNEPVASDILVLSTKNPSGLCFIETADLDGETNLKVRQPLAETCESLNNRKALRDFDGEVRCEPPNNRLEKFNGNLEWNGKTYSLDNNNIVLRGCIMRNTPSVVGVVLYAGHDSKIMMNSGKNMFKKTKLDKMTNQMVIYIAGLLALICTFCSIMSYVFERDTGKKFRVYLPWDTFYQDSPGLIAVINWPGFVMVLNTLIPISLYISVEVIRLGQSLLINWDVKLYDEESKTPAYARNTTLTEELGQIQYIFSDKTGTLTQNVMEFKECSINGKIYGHTQDKNNDDDNDDDMKLEDCQSVDSKECVNLTAENKYADSNFKFYDHDLKSLIDSKTEECLEFFRNLAVCHTVMVEDKERITRSLPDLTDDQGYDTADFVPMQPKDSKAECAIEYQAQSPDEGALVSAARNFGFVFKSRTPNSITIETTLGEEIYDLLCILDFDNVRKRMSVIVRRDDKIMLYCKGADTALYELLSSESKPIMPSTSEHLDAFATEGLRTLVLASRELTQQEYHKWSQMYKEASTAMENRDEKVAEAFEFIERDLTLQGATAIEDKLQDGVPETIFNLAEANIKIWVLTGDKQETAINIGYSSMLLTEDMRDVFIIDGGSTEEVQQQITQATNSTHNANNGTTTPDPDGVKVIGVKNFDGGSIELTQNDSCESCRKEGFALVISGKSLAFALLPEVELSFLELAKSCKAVICCRVTPLQKALVVELVKRNVKATTLAIGDGANDVSMIKAAHIGVGISGKEGRQAVLSSDYSFGQFRFLERLLLVHGRWSYWRMAKFLGYFFYKNFAFTLVQFWYTFFSGFTAQTLYDAMFLSVYNVCFTSLPVLAMGIFDQDVSAENSLRHPRMYIPGQSNLLFNKRQFFLKLVHGILTSLVLFFIAYGVLYDRVNSAGEPESVYDIFSVAVGGILVVVVNLQMALDTSQWTWINHFFIWGSIVFYFLFTFFTTSSFLYASFPVLFPQVSAGEKTFTSGVFWAAMLITCVVCILPVIGYRWCMQKMRPSLAEYVRRGLWKQKRSRSSLLFGRRRSQRSVRRRPESSRSAFAFSQVSGFGEMIMSGKWLPRFGTRGTFDVTSHQSTAS